MIDKLLGAFYGFVVGDALGVPVEFSSREDLKYNPVLEMREYGTHNVPKGIWSDDTSMVLATMDSILEKNGIDYNDIMDRFCNWVVKSEYTANGVFFDIGIATSSSLKRYMNGVSPLKCGGTDDRDNGNGSLMRILPVSLYLFYINSNDDDSALYVRNVSSLTHAHEISCLGCQIYTDFVKNLLNNSSKKSAFLKLRNNLHYYKKYYSDETISYYKRLFNDDFASISENDISSSGFVVNTLEASIWCVLNCNSFSDTVLKSVNLGNDTDTVGAITGSLAGIIYGKKNINNNWLNEVKNKKYLDSIINKFVSYLNSIKSNCNFSQQYYR